MSLSAHSGEQNQHNRFLLAIALLAGLLGQFCLVGPPRNLPLGLILYCSAVAAIWPLMAPMSAVANPSGRRPPEIMTTTGSRWVTLARATATAGCALSLWTLFRHSYELSAFFWVVGWTMCLVAARLVSPVELFEAVPRRDAAVLLALTTLALGLRLMALESVPPLLAGDEAAMGLEGQKVLAGVVRNWFGTGWFSHPSLYFVLQAASQRLWGTRIFALRFTSAVAGSLAIPILYLVARRWWGQRAALIASTLLVSYHFHLHYSRLGLNNIWDALFLLWTLYWLDRAVHEGHAWPWACLGATVGISQYAYWGSRVLPLLVLCALIWHHRCKRGTGRRLSAGWTAGLATFLAVLAPLVLHYVSYPDEWSYRYTQISVLRAGWLGQAATYQDSSAIWVWVQQVLRTLFAFHYYTDTSTLYGAPIPLLDYLAAILFVFGAVAVARSSPRLARVSLALAYGLVLMFGSALVMDPPSSQRLVILSPLLCLLVALGLDRLLSLAQNCLVWGKLLCGFVCVVVVLAVVCGNAYYYFWIYTPGGFFLEPNSELVDVAGRYVRNTASAANVYWVGAPRVYADSPALQFLAPQVHIRELADPIDAGTGRWGDVPAILLVVPERLRELEAVRAQYPQSTVTELVGRDGALLLVVYEVR